MRGSFYFNQITLSATVLVFVRVRHLPSDILKEYIDAIDQNEHVVRSFVVLSKESECVDTAVVIENYKLWV